MKWILAFLLLTPSITFARIANPSIFIGEIVNGGINGAPLTQDLNGKVSSGLISSEISATSATTTTSPSDVVMSGMTSVPVSGTYLVLFSTWCSHSNGNAVITISLYNAGSKKLDSERHVIPFVGALSAITQNIPVSINSMVTTDGTNPVAVEWHTSTGTATCTQRTMDLVRIQ